MAMDSVYNKMNILLKKEDIKNILEKAEITDIKIDDLNLWQLAFVHNSYCSVIKKNKKYANSLNSSRKTFKSDNPKDCIPIFKETNETLELLGDGILQTIIAAYLYKRYPNEDEGFLTKLRSKLVKTETLAKLAKYYGFDKLLIISKEVEETLNGRNNTHILEDAFEAFIGVMYMIFSKNDSGYGYNICRKFIIKSFEECIDFVDLITNDDNYKDQLMRFYQKTFGGKFPVYEIDEIIDKKFHVYVKHPILDKIVGRGNGTTKQKAEQFAAKQALYFLNQPKNKELLVYVPEKKESDKSGSDSDSVAAEEAQILIYNKSNTLITADDIQEICGVECNDLDIWINAFVHNSYTDNLKKNKKYEDFLKQCQKNGCGGELEDDCLPLFKISNERLKWLGDAILQGIVGSYLWKRFPKEDEGFLTKLRSKLVKTDMLYKLAKNYGFDDFIIISKYIEDNNNGRDNPNILENTFEAFLAAMFIDNDDNDKEYLQYAICEKFIISTIENVVDLTELILNDDNYKDLLMKLFQKKFNGKFPIYTQENYNKDTKIFTMNVLHPTTNAVIGRGDANNKQKAEQMAAKMAIEFINA